MKKLPGYCLLSFEVIYTAWEWMFLLAAAFFLTSIEHGGLISSILFFTTAGVRVLGAKRIAAEIANRSIIAKFSLALIARFGLFILALCLFFLKDAPNYIWIVWMILAAILFISDGYASIDFRYILSQNEHFSFGRIGSFLNIGKRGTIAITSLIALQIPSGDWRTLGLILCVPIFFGIVSMAWLLFFVNTNPFLLLERQTSVSEKSTEIWRTGKEVRALALYLFAFNLFFGANGLMVIKAITSYKLELYAINPLTIFYASFVFTNVVTMIYPKLAERFSDWRSICLLYILTAGFCIGYWGLRNNVFMFMVAALCFGMAYALQTTCVFVKLYKEIKGNNQANHLARIDTVSKLGFIVSQLSVGLLLDAGFDPLLLSATFGLASVIALGIYMGICQGLIPQHAKMRQTPGPAPHQEEPP
ncbi:hypothetical protein V8G57_18180 [Collimonas sp. H4R21]|uniref:MFS transporter n=1 Tax=Collimonas rhizosphaerae TaxID=3126357 RepID=A0ABU9PZ83_9BURK